MSLETEINFNVKNIIKLTDLKISIGHELLFKEKISDKSYKVLEWLTDRYWYAYGGSSVLKEIIACIDDITKVSAVILSNLSEFNELIDYIVEYEYGMSYSNNITVVCNMIFECASFDEPLPEEDVEKLKKELDRLEPVTEEEELFVDMMTDYLRLKLENDRLTKERS